MLSSSHTLSHVIHQAPRTAFCFSWEGDLPLTETLIQTAAFQTYFKTLFQTDAVTPVVHHFSHGMTLLMFYHPGQVHRIATYAPCGPVHQTVVTRCAEGIFIDPQARLLYLTTTVPAAVMPWIDWLQVQGGTTCTLRPFQWDVYRAEWMTEAIRRPFFSDSYAWASIQLKGWRMRSGVSTYTQVQVGTDHFHQLQALQVGLPENLLSLDLAILPQAQERKCFFPLTLFQGTNRIQLPLTPDHLVCVRECLAFFATERSYQ